MIDFIPRDAEKWYSMISEMWDEDIQDKKTREVKLKCSDIKLLVRLININILVNSLESENEVEMIVTERERNNVSMVQTKNE
jgi:hypothetical protein